MNLSTPRPERLGLLEFTLSRAYQPFLERQGLAQPDG
jgi:hypothetical protein